MFPARNFFPTHDLNRMANEGDLVAARDLFLRQRPNNLNYLLNKRYSWMNHYLQSKEHVIEVGSGAGFSKEFIHHSNFQLTDVEKYDWIDVEADALNLPFDDGSIDAVISSHMIHHLAKPVVFFREMIRVLKPGGYVVIQEINTSMLMRTLLRVMRHEGWAYDVDVFDEETISNDPADPWSANCAIPYLLFHNPSRFEREFPELKIIKNTLCEGFIFPISGGVIAKAKTCQLPIPVLKAVDALDEALIRCFPSIFALGRMIVLERQDS